MTKGMTACLPSWASSTPPPPLHPKVVERMDPCEVNHFSRQMIWTGPRQRYRFCSTDRCRTVHRTWGRSILERNIAIQDQSKKWTVIVVMIWWQWHVPQTSEYKLESHRERNSRVKWENEWGRRPNQTQDEVRRLYQKAPVCGAHISEMCYRTASPTTHD